MFIPKIIHFVCGRLFVCLYLGSVFVSIKLRAGRGSRFVGGPGWANVAANGLAKWSGWPEKAGQGEESLFVDTN